MADDADQLEMHITCTEYAAEHGGFYYRIISDARGVTIMRQSTSIGDKPLWGVAPRVTGWNGEEFIPVTSKMSSIMGSVETLDEAKRIILAAGAVKQPVPMMAP